ncbi:hypothetical protein LTR86_003407 [Recurvomyces mirabilis]|nr:hypothetical protein LTR86_003407 [Recurvomyces mirabilis]
MYGADKIPDSWFERVPGGFYKTKDGRTVAAGSGSATAAGSGNSRPSTSEGKSSGRGRRHSTGEATRGPPPDAEMDSGYRSSGGGGSGGGRRHREQRRQERSSYDGMEDEEGSYTGDDRRRRRNHSSSRRTRRNGEDEDRGYAESPRDDRQDNRRGNRYGAAPYPERDFGPTARSHHPGMAGAAAMGAAAGAAAAHEAPYSPSETRSPPPFSPQPQHANTDRSQFSGGYVPYAHIYGSNDRQAPTQTFSPAPQSTYSGSVQPNETNRVMHPVAPPPDRYQQDAYAQDGATAAANGAGADYSGQSSFYPPEYDTAHDPRYMNRREGDRNNGYDGHGNSHSPPSRRDSHRRYEEGEESSHDSASYSPPRNRDKRSRDHDHRRQEDPSQRSKSQGGRQGKSQQLQQNLREHFDPSQRGLGYSAVGALAGGLAGSEFAKGPLGIGLGAVVGALGANAYEARERYVPSSFKSANDAERRGPGGGMMAVDPRLPLGAQSRGEGGDDKLR